MRKIDWSRTIARMIVWGPIFLFCAGALFAMIDSVAKATGWWAILIIGFPVLYIMSATYLSVRSDEEINEKLR